jgi:hypothetical protein
MPMPIAPPARSPSSHTSMLCAQPAACRAVSAASSGSVSQRGSRPAAFLGHPAERGVGGRPQVVAADHPAHVPAQVDAAHQDHRPRVRRPPGHPVRVPVADHGDRPVRHQVLVPYWLTVRKCSSGAGIGMTAPVRAEHAGRAQVGAERHRQAAQTRPAKPQAARAVRAAQTRGDLQRLPVRVTHGRPGAHRPRGPAARSGSPSRSGGR